ncbi:MAG: long-chain fatty acid--CoA ligase [Gemmatimonadota bacterium]
MTDSIPRLREDVKAYLSDPSSWETRDNQGFNALALRVFRHQVNENPMYGSFVRHRLGSPGSVERWEDIPPVPARAFKEFSLISGDPGSVRLIFRTSGTTGGQGRRGRHHVQDPELYEASLRPTFQRHLIPEDEPISMVSLVPPTALTPHSSLGFMVEVVMKTWGAPGSGHFAHPDTGVQVPALHAALEEFAEGGKPVLFMGTAFAFVHWMDAMDAKGWRIRLPTGSRIMETGGFKGRSREVSREDLYSALEERLGIPTVRMVNEYGMTELLSQFYEPTLVPGDPGPSRRHVAPPWLRTQILHPETLEPVPPGEPGLLSHLDLANLDSVACVLTEDLGVAAGDGFRLLGRAIGAEPRGCSLTMEALLDAQGR